MQDPRAIERPCGYPLLIAILCYTSLIIEANMCGLYLYQGPVKPLLVLASENTFCFCNNFCK